MGLRKKNVRVLWWVLDKEIEEVVVRRGETVVCWWSCEFNKDIVCFPAPGDKVPVKGKMV